LDETAVHGFEDARERERWSADEVEKVEEATIES